MKAKDDFAGRKIKCPQCNQVVRIPRVPTGPPVLPAVPLFVPERTAPIALAAPEVLLATPVLARVAASSAVKPLHVWVDRSLMQQPTAWLPGDEDRFMKGMKPRHVGMSVLTKSGLALLFCGGIGILLWVVLIYR